MLGAGAATASVPPGVVAIPVRDGSFEGAVEMHRAEALTLLAEQSFNFEEFGPGRLDILADLVRRSRCYRVSTANLRGAVDTIAALLAQTASVS